MTTAIFMVISVALGLYLGDLYGYERGWAAAWKKIKKNREES